VSTYGEVGDYGLGLIINGDKNNIIGIHSKEMVGNPNSFLLPTPQEAVLVLNT